MGNRYHWFDKTNMTAVEWVQKHLISNLQIDKQTKIASIGSCFAREIRNWLIKNKFNYIVTENNKMPWESNKIFKGDKVLSYEHGSAAWERVYNTFTIKQIIDYTFNDDQLTNRLIGVNINGEYYISDVLRTRIIYKNMNIAHQDIKDHIRCSRNVLSNVNLLIITLGLTEIWEDKISKLIVASNPEKYYKLPSNFTFRVSDYQENLSNLNHVYNLLKKHNPTLKILVTVSPVHLLKTYRDDVDVITASCESKSILRAVAGEFSHNEDVYYFPSYEIATVVSTLDRIDAYPDSHHVSQELIDIIMDIFNNKCVQIA